MNEVILQAVDEGMLRQQLRALDIAMEPRGAGRDKNQTERYAISILISTLLHNGRLEFPLELLHRDRPDFQLRMGQRVIGIEVTESIRPKVAELSAIFNRECTDADFYSSEIATRNPDLTVAEMREHIEQMKLGGLTGSPVMEGGFEQWWAEDQLRSINKKLTVFVDDGYEKYPENWLCVHGRGGPDPLKGFEQFLRPRLAMVWNDATNGFDRIFIQATEVVFDLDKASTSILALKSYGQGTGYFKILTATEIGKRVLELLEAQQIKPDALYLYGSFAQGSETPLSDIDIALLLGASQQAVDLFRLKGLLRWELGREIDLIDLSKVSTVLQKEVISGGIRIYEKTMELAIAWEAHVLSAYSKLNEERAEILADFFRTGIGYSGRLPLH